MRIDFHSHILPGIDDGAANVDESLKLLEILKKDGVEKIVATPHLYLHKQNADKFLSSREKSASEVFNAAKGLDLPEIVLGAEVYFSPALNEMNLKDICIEKTDYILIELPYQVYSSAFLRMFTNFVNGCGIKVILAHIERFYEINKKEVMDEILSSGVLTQVNCDSLTYSRSKRRVLKLIENGTAQLLGTDLHKVKSRPPLFGKAEKVIGKKLSVASFDKMMILSEMVLNNEKIDVVRSYE